MDKLKYIKLENEDGSYSNSIPLAVDGQYVDINGETLINTLNTKPYYYNTVADMKADTKLKAGDMAVTLGYHTKNDDGKALYKIRTTTNNDVIDERKIIALNNNNLIAELIVNNKINVKQIGAYGNDTNDDTEILQYAMNNFDNVYIPKGTYKITNQLNLKSNLHLSGDGATSIIKSYFEYNDVIKYILISDSTSNSITRTIIDNLQFMNNNVNTLSGGIYVEFSTRGLVLNNLWFNVISNCIRLGDKIWGIASLTNIFATYLADNISDELKNLAIGIYCQGNTTYGKNIEIIGTYHYGLYLNECSVGSWQDTNISGSTSQYLMKNGIKIENSNDIDLNSCWLEQLADGSGVLTKTIEVINSKQISLNNMHLSSGSMFVDNSENVKIYNTRYYTTSVGLRYLNNSKITCDKISLGYCNYQANEEYCMGDINIIDFSNQSNENLLNNPILLQGIYEFLSITNSASTKTTNTTDMLTGDRCFNFNTSNYQGARVNTSNILENGKKYTILAYVKAVSDNIDKIYLKTSGISADTTHPNQFYKNIDNNKNYHLIRLTGTVNNETNNVDIIARSKDSNKCDFIIDSVFIVEGQHDNTIPSALNKEGILRNSKLTASTAPYAGIWNKGDIVYNNFVNSSNDNIMFWIYDGTNWVSKLINT